MDGSNRSITADINEILRETDFLNSIIHLHCSEWQVFISHPSGQKVIYGRRVFINLLKIPW